MVLVVSGLQGWLCEMRLGDAPVPDSSRVEQLCGKAELCDNKKHCTAAVRDRSGTNVRKPDSQGSTGAGAGAAVGAGAEIPLGQLSSAP